MPILNTANLQSSVSDEGGQKSQLATSSNTVRVNNADTDITISLSAGKNWTVAKDVFTVFVTIENNTDINIEDIYMIGTLGEGASYVANTVKVGSVLHEDFDMQQGFNILTTLGALGNEMTVSYDVAVDEFLDVSTISDMVKIKINLDDKEFELQSNTLSLQVLDNDVSILKTADSKVVRSGDRINYTITITNNGQLLNTDMFFVDQIPQGTSFVAGSVVVGGDIKQDADPNQGFALEDLPAQESITISFAVTVD